MDASRDLLEVLQRRVEGDPDAVVYRFLNPGGGATEWSYADLLHRATTLAGAIQDRVPKAVGSRVLLLYPAGLEYLAALLACMQTHAIAVPAYPPTRHHALRLARLVDDAKPSLVLCDRTVFDQLGRFEGLTPTLIDVPVLSTESVSNDWAAQFRPPATRPDIGFLQYTSGSTGAPKGVVVTQQNLIANLASLSRARPHPARAASVSWLPLYHDMGLIGCALRAIFVDAPTTLMSPRAFTERPLRWLEAITEVEAYVSGAPNFAYDYCVSRAASAGLDGLDLTSWKVAFCGAEPISASTLRRFTETFADVGFDGGAYFPCYGMAESTLLIAGAPVRSSAQSVEVERDALARGVATAALADPSSSRREIVSCGGPWGESAIRIVDPDTGLPCAPGEVGEVWCTGPSVARGYWGRVALSVATFQARLPDDDRDFLRTGDLGFLRDGELFITGRLKDLLIVRGLNHNPEDIERYVEETEPTVTAGAVACFQHSAGENDAIVLACEVGREALRAPSERLRAICQTLRRQVIEHFDVRLSAIALVRPGHIPRTSSGKVMRSSCRRRFEDDALETVYVDLVGPEPDRERIELDSPDADPAFLTFRPAFDAADEAGRQQIARRVLVTLIRRATGTSGDIEGRAGLVEHGLDSIQIAELLHHIEEELGMRLALGEVLDEVIVDELIERIASAPRRSSVAIIKPSATNGTDPVEFPLSAGQESVWFVHQQRQGNDGYNVHVALTVPRVLDAKVLARAVEVVQARHPVLRTAYGDRNGIAYQRVCTGLAPDIQLERCDNWSVADREREVARAIAQPFDLAAGRVFRVAVFNDHRNQTGTLVLCAHHIAIDFWSLSIVFEELGELYAAGADASGLASPGLDYRAFVTAQSTRVARDGDAWWGYWSQQLSGELAPLALPTTENQVAGEFSGDAVAVALDGATTASLRALAKDNQTTLFVVLLSMFAALLHRYCAQRDFFIGIPTSGRTDPAFSRTVGYFVNPLPIRFEPAPGEPFDGFLRTVRRTVVDAIRHQELPFSTIVERLNPARELDTWPLYQVAFTLQSAQSGLADGLAALALGQHGQTATWGGIDVSSIRADERVENFDLKLVAAETDDGVLASFQFNRRRIAPETIQAMATHFGRCVDAIVGHSTVALRDLPLVIPADRGWPAKSTVRERAALPVHARVELQAFISPNAPAVVDDERTLSYRELNRAADQLAQRLTAGGVCLGDRVAIFLPRGTAFVVSALAIMKAGGVYLPIAPDTPGARAQAVIAQGEAIAVVTEPTNSAGLTEGGHNAIWFESSVRPPVGARQPASDCVPLASGAYLIFTSGSTGKPKGVGVSHGALNNLIDWHLRAYEIAPEHRASQVAGLGFDASVWEIWPYLVGGASVHVVSEANRLEPERLVNWLSTERITHAFLPTPLAEAVLSPAVESTSDLSQLSLQVLLTGGDRLGVLTCAAQAFRLVNHYGPTENAVVATCGDVGWGSTAIPTIGRAIDGVQSLILDESLNPMPDGCEGDLYVTGESLATGYFGQAALTAERFVPDPFGPGGARMYATGDRVARRANGELEFRGRRDDQLKVRGFRIEPAEIEAALRTHNVVRDAAVILKGGHDRRPTLTAYLLPEVKPDAASNRDLIESAHVDDWRSLYDATYAAPAIGDDASFNIVGWASSYDGEALPEREMAMWLDDIVELIAERPLGRVLEVGCGTGLLLARLARQSVAYVGTDISDVALQQVGEFADQAQLSHVTLVHAAADELGEIGDGFDTVILNSVVQYFPNQAYLERVCADLVRRVANGGRLIIGDVRDFNLLRAFHCDIAYSGTPSSTRVAQFSEDVQFQEAAEQELLVAPQFFSALGAQLPRLTGVELRLKPGAYHNELARFRFDAVLHVGDAGVDRGSARLREQSWTGPNDIEDLVLEMTAGTLGRVALRNIPNRRLQRAVALSKLSNEPRSRLRLSDIADSLGDCAERGCDPSDLVSLAASHGYRCYPFVAAAREPAHFDALFLPADGQVPYEYRRRDPTDQGVGVSGPFCNDPLRRRYQNSHVPSIRNAMAAVLPAYMVPDTYVFIDAFPLSPSGKVDRKALPAIADRKIDAPKQATTPLQSALVDIWEEVLGIAPIAINQNFFDLGGDSILSIQVISRARDRGIRIAPRQMFEHQTIESLADAVANQTSAGPDDAVKSSITLSDAERTRFQSDYQRWDGVFPVSPLQSGLWFHDQADAGSVYIEQLQILLRGRLDPDALRETLMDTLGAHPALRAGFDFLDDDTPVQVIGSLGQMSIPFYVLDLRGSAESETDDVRDRVDALLVDDYRQPFDLNRPPLMRVTLVRKASDEWLLIWTHHHLLLDGWSVPIVLREWFDRYSAKTAGDEFSSALPDPYLACLERLTGQSKAHEAAAGEYWAAQFDGFDGPTIVTDPVAPGAEATRGWAFAEAQWSREQSTAVTTFCREHRLTLNTVVQASVALALSTLGARRDVVFGAIESGRSIPVSGIETAVGLLISALPMRFDCNPGRDVLQWLREGQDRTLRSAEFGGYSLADISRWMGKRDQDPLFEVLVAFENYPVTDYVGQEFGDLALVDIDYRDQTHYPLTLVFSANETISLRVGYQTDRFRREWIARIGGLIEQYALEIVATGAHQTLGQLRTITGADAQRLTAWSRAETTYPRTDTLVERLQNEAARSPSRIALQHRDRTMTYRELAAQSDRYALALQREGIGRGAFVGLAMARGLELIVSLVAVLKTGAAYVPLETQHPTARLRELINANRIGWVICDEPNRAVSDCTARALLVETLRDDDRRLDRKQGSGREWNAIPITATDPAYVIFTSGSTGQPKGVVVTHQNVLRLFDALPEDLTISGDDVFSLAHSIAFDFSVWELWGALLFGGRCVVVDHDTVRDPQAFARDIREHGVSILSQTPSAFYELQDALTAQSRPPALRRVVFGGEALTTTRLRPWFAHFGDDERCFVNMYGITETTVHVTASTITADDAMQGRDSIGRPLSDLSAHVLDPFGRPMPLGVVGELFVGGAGVADGYLGRPGLTASRFVPDPFADSPGARLYRTGDLARWDEAGNLEYRGRIDRQVQLHGFRIESGEIEHTLSTLPTIRDVAVVVREESNRHELVAYVVGDRDEGSLRRFADAQLPAHMRPKFYVWLDTIPKTLNGKLDFASFPTVDVADGGGVMASNELEGTLTEIWCEVLSLDAIGVTDNFFAMGGDSILCMQVVNRAHRRGIVFTPTQLFEHQTIRELATVAGRPQGHRIVNAERPVGSTPLTPIQRWFFEQSLPEPNHWNQSVLVPIDASISVESLGNALNKVITRHANFRLQFSAQDGVWAQRYADAEPGVPIVTLDDAAGDAAIIATCAAAQASLDINQGRTLSGVVLPARGQTSRQLLLCAHHLIIDAVSWRVLLEDLQAEIDTPSNGEAPSWQSDSFQSWSNALRDYGNGQGLRAERVFWLNLTWDRVADLTLDYPERSNLERDFQHIVLTLGADETSRLTRDSAEAYNTRTTDLLLAALTRTLLSEGAGDALRVDVEGHGREDVVAGVDITRTVGWFTSQFPVLLHRANQSLRDDIVQTKESLRAIPNRGIGYGLLRYGDDEGLREQFAALPRASVSFNYLGHFDQEWAESSSLFAAPESIVHLTGAQRGGSNPRYYELDINIAVLAGELRLSWGYGARMSRERMEALAQAYLQELNALVAHCVTDGVEGFTPSDFPLANQLDQKTLDSLLKVL